RAAFLDNWAEAAAEHGHVWRLPDVLARGQDRVTPAGTSEVQVVRSTASAGWSDVSAVTELATAMAKRRLLIGTAYFTPDPATVEQLCEAARRGVEVEIMLPWPHMDIRVSQLAGSDAITPLLSCGVSVQVYQPTMYHAKITLVDEDIAIIGSANFNRRSAQRDDEVCLVCRDAELAATLRTHWEEDRTRCAPVNLKRWRRRGTWRRLKERAARIIKPMV
ncbi:MAG TPA: phospholipase D-like domain-containing protein, partial [Acetobacteraceae bacterium]|nr:phospholipase D-like domain-containing protein [Acetobacteraceae bacterium]